MKRRTWYVTGGALLLAVVGAFAVFGGAAPEYPQTMHVTEGNVCRIRAGAGETFDVVGLIAEEDEVVALEMAKGENDRTWYRIDKSSLPDDMDISADECYIRSDLLVKN